MNLKLIGERIKNLRITNNVLSQEDFSKSIGFDRTYMSRIESGKQNLTIKTLIKICDGLNITLKDFFDF